jgi:hypothetical protein
MQRADLRQKLTVSRKFCFPDSSASLNTLIMATVPEQIPATDSRILRKAMQVQLPRQLPRQMPAQLPRQISIHQYTYQIKIYKQKLFLQQR